MCQQYEAERQLVTWLEEIDHKNGKPDRCDNQAGYVNCNGRVHQVFREPKELKGWGWECNDCGKFFRSEKQL